MLSLVISYAFAILLVSSALKKKLLDPWKILIIDDAIDIHMMTKSVLRHFKFDDRPLRFISAYSADEARKVISGNNHFALVILDVKMESGESGLDLIADIRKSSLLTRIVIRTGHAGRAPVFETLTKYDLHDYLEKGDTTTERLGIMFFSALRTFKLLKVEADFKRKTEKILSKLPNIVDFISDYDYVQPQGSSILFDEQNSANFIFNDLFLYFSEKRIYRVGRSLAVNPTRVKAVEKISSREIYLCMNSGARLLIPRDAIFRTLEHFSNLL